MHEIATSSAANAAPFPPPQASLQTLVSGWWRRSERPHILQVWPLREALYEAALAEIRLQARQGKVYDPGTDNRFKWACQWLEAGEGHRHTIDPNLAMIVEYLFANPRTLSGKELAAGELQPLTLGS